MAQDSDYFDLINLTRRKQVPYKMQDLAGSIRDYGAKRIIKDQSDSFESGADGWEWRILKSYASSARMVGTRSTDVYAQSDNTHKRLQVGKPEYPVMHAVQ